MENPTMDADVPMYEVARLSAEKQHLVQKSIREIEALQTQLNAAQEALAEKLLMSKPEGGARFDLDTMTWYGPQEPEQGEDNDETSD